MSINANIRQQIAIHYLAMGYTSSEVASKIKVRRETRSRWKKDENFNKKIKDAHIEYLKEIKNKQLVFLELSQQVFESFLANQDAEPYQKSRLALQFMKQFAGGTTLEKKLHNQIQDAAFDNPLFV